MKIAFLNIYQGTVDRGAEVFVQEVAERLARNHLVQILSNRAISEEKARSQTGFSFLGKVLYKLYLDAHSRRVLFFTLGLVPKLLTSKYDWVVPVDAGWQLLIVKLLQPFKKYRILVSGQAGIGRDDLRNLRMNPDVFVALTNRAYEWAKEVNPKVKVVKIPNGVDLQKFQPEGEKAPISLEKPIILCVAGLNPYKRVNLTIKAVAKLGKGSLLLIGDGPQREEIDKLGKQLLGNRYLRLTVSHDELPAYYRSADLFTLVSGSSEAFGIAYLEAMASGLPVVATDDEIRHEIVGEAGLFVNPSDIDIYSTALSQALNTDFNGKSRHQSEHFSWDKISSEYEKVMSDMVKS